MTVRVWGEQDRVILRRWEAERNALVGPTAAYYCLVRGAHVDPLYNEPTADPLYAYDATGTDAQHPDAFHYEGPFGIVMAVIFERTTGRDATADETGFEATFDGEAFVARDEWEARRPGTLPKEGDVLSINDEWWDVKAANTGGHATDSGHYVGWKLGLRKRDRFTPDRKV